MMYAKIKDSMLSQFPYSFAELQADNPYTRFDSSKDLVTLFAETEYATLLGFSLAEVSYAEDPVYDPKTQKLVYAESPELISGSWIIPVTIVNKPSEVIASEYDAIQVENRHIRNTKLSVCDWTQMPDAPLTQEQKTVWSLYRQALRDVPQQEGFPWNIVWPTVPE